jgi:serine/threonine protein kinase
MTLQPGDLLHDRYRILGIIGKGGMGAVYRGEDTVLQATVAIKENLNPLPQAVKQFKREALLLASLRHPNLPRVTDHFIEGDLQYLIMDYVPGDDLKTILERQGALPETQVIGWCREICDALTYLHEQHPPVTHRDVKPANIKITPDGKPVLVDFGIAKASEAGGVTTTGARSLTPGFAPPEQYGSSPTDSRSDQYSLAATLYNLLTGHIPPDSLERALEQTQLKPVRELNPKVSPAVDATIWKAMSISPSERFLNMKEFFSALQGDIELSVASPDATLPSSREPLTVIRRTPEKTTKEKAPPPAPEAPAGRRRVPVYLLAGIGAVLCLALTGVAVGGYALSAGWPPAAKTTRTPTVHQTSEKPPAPTPTASPTATRTPTVEPTPNGGSPLLAFVSNRNGNKYQVYTYNLATKEIVQLTSDPAEKGRLAWSPDGKQIYYEGKTAATGWDIFRMDADGSNPVNLTNFEGDDTYPAPSPLGNSLAFQSNRYGTDHIFLMAADGSGVLNISAKHDIGAFHMPPEYNPAWAPDGLTLYFTANITGKWRVFRWNMNFPGYTPLIVTMTEGDYWEGEMAVSPTDEYVAYTRYHGMSGEICIAPTDLSKRQECTQPLTRRANSTDPDWSADGQRLAYTSTSEGSGDIFTITISGAEDLNITQDPARDRYPAFQPAPATT